MVLSDYHRKERVIHGIKTALACIVGFFANSLFGSNGGGPWILITIATVMCAQLYVGSVFKKAYLRLLGTLAGTLMASGAILIAGGNSIGFIIAIAIAGFIFSFFSVDDENLSFAGTLGLVTTIIILLSQHPDLYTAGIRCFEIAIGIVIAGLISQFILPINARTHLKRAQVDTLEQIRQYFLHVTQPIENQNVDYHELDEAIVKLILKQRKLAKESSPEFIGEKFNSEQFMELLYTEREMLRAITFMHIAFVHHKHLQKLLTDNAAIHSFNERISNVFKNLIDLMRAPTSSDKKVHIPTLKSIKESLQEPLSHSSTDEHINADGFLFSANILIQGLKNFAKLQKISFEE
jgi:uncharacterized membrane protein YccC